VDLGVEQSERCQSGERFDVSPVTNKAAIRLLLNFNTAPVESELREIEAQFWREHSVKIHYRAHLVGDRKHEYPLYCVTPESVDERRQRQGGKGRMRR